MSETQNDNPPAETAEKKFSQDELNHFLAEERRSTEARFSDYQSLKDQVADLDNIKAEAFESGKAEATEQLTSELVKAEIKSAATALGFHSMDDAIAFYGDCTDITYDPEKGVDANKIHERLTQLANEKPYLVTTANDSGSSRPKPKSTTPSDSDTSTPQEKAVAALRQKYNSNN